MPSPGVIRMSEPPATVRAAALPSRGATRADQETYDVLTAMKVNLEFLQSLLSNGDAPALALDALDDLERGIARLERGLVRNANARRKKAA